MRRRAEEEWSIGEKNRGAQVERSGEVLCPRTRKSLSCHTNTLTQEGSMTKKQEFMYCFQVLCFALYLLVQ